MERPYSKAKLFAHKECLVEMGETVPGRRHTKKSGFSLSAALSVAVAAVAVYPFFLPGPR